MSNAGRRLDVFRAADLARTRRALWLTLASGVLLGLALLTEQTAVAVAVVMTVNIAALSGRPLRLVSFVGLGALLTLGLAALVLVAQYGPWPELYLVDLPRQHSLQLQRLADFSGPPDCCQPLRCRSSRCRILLSFAGYCSAIWPRSASGCWPRWACWVWRGAPLNLWSGNNVVLPSVCHPVGWDSSG